MGTAVRRRSWRFAIVTAFVLAGAACASSDEADEPDDASSTESVATSVGDAPTVATGATDGPDADSAAFCDQIRMLEQSGDTDGDLALAAEQFADLVDQAPDDLRGDLEVVSEALSEMSGLDEDDPDSFVLIFEIFGRPEVIEASENLERYGVEECGLEPSSDFDDEADPIDIDLGTDDTDDDAERLASGDDRYDEEFWGTIVATEMSIPGIKQHLDVYYPETGWFEDLNGYGITQDTSVAVDGPIEEADGVALCDAILEYAAPLEPDVTITVGDDAGDTFATGNVADGCSATT